MTPVVITAAAILFGISALAFAIGFVMGRLEERAAVCDWLWEEEVQSVWPWARAIEFGEHRKRRP